MMQAIIPVYSHTICSRPRFTLAQNVPVTPQFRAEFDVWALKFFGVEEQIIMANGAIYMSPEAIADFARKLK